MHGFKKLALFVSALLPLASALPQSANKPTNPPAESLPPLPNQYIVTLKDTVSDLGSHLTWVDGIHARSLGRRELGLAGVEETYNITKFKGYAGAFDDATIAQIKANPQVEDVEQDEIWVTLARTTQQEPPSWGLAAISSSQGGRTKSNPLVYAYDDTAGAGTYAYVLDTGINANHEDFRGRIDKTHNVYHPKSRKMDASNDRQGHGTHVAGIIAGTTYGVAKKAKIVAVKVVRELKEYLVFGEYVTTKSSVLLGYNWAVDDIEKNNRRGKSVINVSMGSSPIPEALLDDPIPKTSTALRMAVESALELDVFTVVSAGNTGVDAKYACPANVPGVFTVGSSGRRNYVSEFSNWGHTVDIFAPGELITSAMIGSSTADASWNGTSMAAPHVAGLALNLMAMGYNKPAAIGERIQELSTKGLIRPWHSAMTRAGTPTNFLYNNNGHPM